MEFFSYLTYDIYFTAIDFPKKAAVLPELIKAVDKKLRKAQRLMSKKELGSKNRNKQRIKVIINGNLAVKNMIKNRKLSRANYYLISQESVYQ